MKKTVTGLGIFVFVVIISGWLGVGVDSQLTGQPEGNTLGMGIWLVLPLFTALLIMLFSRTSWKEFGFKPHFKGNIKWYLVSLLIYPVVSAIILLIGAATNWIDLSAFHPKQFVLVFCAALSANLVIDFFEETAWRGYLTSQLLKFNLNDWKLYLIIGCVWTIWHIPYYLVFLPEADIQAIMPVSRGVYVLLAFMTFLSWTVMFTELFRVTNSVWPCIFLHTVEDAIINQLTMGGFIAIAAGKEILLSPVNGIITCILYIAVGLLIRAYRIRAQQKLVIDGGESFT
jgi:hypothetical protein